MFQGSINKINFGKIVTFLGLFLLIFIHLNLVSKTFFIDTLGNIKTAAAGYGDIPLHLTQVSKFAFGKFNFEEPIFFGNILNYPFFINLISGLLLKITGNFYFSVLSPIYVLTVSNIILAYVFFNKILKNYVISLLSTLVFFLGAGLEGFNFIQKAILNKESISYFLDNMVANTSSTITKWDASYPAQNVDFGTPLSLAFLHQRSFFLGFFLFSLFIIYLLKISDKKSKKYHILIASLILGLMPLSHTHSFVAAFIALFSLGFVSLIFKNFILVRKLLTTLLLSSALTLPQLAFLVGQKSLFTTTSNFFEFRIGWMVTPTIGAATFAVNQSPTALSLEYFNFLWVNFGIILPFFIVSFIWLLILTFKKLKKSQELFYPFWMGVSAFVTFLSVQLIKFQPWDYDDNKLLVYFQFFAVGLSFFLLLKIINKKKIIGAILLFFYLVMSLTSGFLDIYPRLAIPNDQLPTIFSKDAIETSNFIRKKIPQDDLIITGDGHLNVVSSLAGRPVLVGYPGWLWTRGIDYSDRLNKLTKFFQHPSRNNEIVKNFDAKYVLLDNQTRNEFNTNDRLFGNDFQQIFKLEEYTVYKIK